MKNCSVTIETTVNYDWHTVWAVVKHPCLHFFPSFSQGPDAPIHNLPKGAPPPNSQDNNLDPSAKANQQLLILMSNFFPLSLFVCKLTCLLATQKIIFAEKCKRWSRQKRAWKEEEEEGVCTPEEVWGLCRTSRSLQRISELREQRFHV